ncbi:helix-turn-helix domain-containing protein [Enterococcus rotai]|uniref:helix-turn-helix domain-containing protein n=1 Tax=Enterococcus rotai TaxID=118060 RepID=UPI0032B4CEE7
MKMRSTIDTTVAVKLDIVDFLYRSSFWMSSEEIADRLKLDKKTIHKYTNELSEDILDFNKESIVLESIKGKGIKLQVTDSNDYRIFLQFLMDDTLTINIVKAIALKKGNSLVTLASDNFVSESTVRRKIQQLRDYIDLMDISIISRSGYYSIVGDEKEIRLFLFLVFWKLYRGRAWPFTGIAQQKMLDLVEAFSQTSELRLKEINKQKIAFLLAVCLFRFQKNETVDLSQIDSKLLQLCEIIDKESTISQILYTHYRLTKEESIFLILLGLTRPSMYFFPIGNLTVIDICKELSLDYYMTTKTILTELLAHFQVEAPPEIYTKIFNTLLANHLYLLMNPGTHYDNNGYYIYPVISSSYPVLISKIKEFIHSKVPKELLQEGHNTELLTSFYFFTLSQLIDVKRFEPEINIYFESDLNLIAEEAIVKQISSYLTNTYNVYFYTQLAEINQDKIDLIVSTSAVPTLIELQDLSIPHVNVYPEVLRKELETITEAITQVLEKKYALLQLAN